MNIQIYLSGKIYITNEYTNKFAQHKIIEYFGEWIYSFKYILYIWISEYLSHTGLYACWFTNKGSAAEHVLYFKCHKKYYNVTAYNRISIIIFCMAPALERIFYDAWSLDIVWCTSSASVPSFTSQVEF